MSVKPHEIRTVDINFEDGIYQMTIIPQSINRIPLIAEGPIDSRNSSRNSMVDEINSHYSYTDSDLHDFQKMERDIYGSHCEDESSQEHDVKIHTEIFLSITHRIIGIFTQIIHEYLEEVTDEQTESLEFVRPHVPVRPSLGNPIDTYDQLRTHYEPINDFSPPMDIVENHVEIVS